MGAETILEMQGIHKSFGKVVALDDVSLQVNKREIHGLLGGNGAGKTTLMNVLYGLYKPDGGDVTVDGQPVEIRSPRDAIDHGIGMVHQHYLQVENFSVAQNIVLGTPLQNRPTLDLEDQVRKIRALSEQFGLQVDPHAAVDTLPMGVRQRVEILKALYRGARLLILDEPTTNLTPQQVQSLFHSLRKIVDEGLSVIFITHKLREVQAICDRITVLRQGRNVLTMDREAASSKALVKAMVGDEVDVEQSLQFAQAGLEDEGWQVSETPVLDVEDLTLFDEGHVPLLDRCSFTVHEGEILGLAGVAGNGQNALAAVLMGLQRATQGEITLRERDVTTASTRALLEAGVAYVPENRLTDGYLPGANVAQNLVLGAHRRPPYSDGLFLNWKEIFGRARALIQQFNIKTQGPTERASNLSGGNIQRLMLARAFSNSPTFLIAHNPSQGLDIPSIEFLYSLLLERKGRGMATLLISEDDDELFLLCHRIAVIYRGRIVGVLARDRFDKYELGRLMSGANGDE
jgi:simple sugar transport system ATP-binding protein